MADHTHSIAEAGASIVSYIPGAWEKLKRADKHIEDFEVGFTAFKRDNPSRLVVNNDAIATAKPRFVLPTHVPLSLTCTVGDAIHNLRSALDHLAHIVARHNLATLSVLKRVNFLIRRTPKAFNDAISRGEVETARSI